jgi:glucose/mannose-6-phosphate isomerase
MATKSYRKLLDLRGSLDKTGMLGLVSLLPKQMEEAWLLGERFAGKLSSCEFDKVVVCGMGGSAIGGDMVRSFAGSRLSVPLHVNRNYSLPHSLVENALVVFSSYSGNTAETLSSYNEIAGRDIPKLAITSGGRLEELCGKDAVPYCKIPGGLPPRAAIAYSFFPLLRTLAALGVATIEDSEFEEALGKMTSLCDLYASDAPENYAAELAHEIKGMLPFVYTCGNLFEAVGKRWCCQFNENGKTLAHHAVFPELNHNEIVGWKALEPLRSRIILLSLEDEEDHPMARKQAEISLEIASPHCGGIVKVPGVRGARMARVLAAMALGDFASVYLAYLNGIDPTPVSNIDLLKESLRKFSS